MTDEDPNRKVVAQGTVRFALFVLAVILISIFALGFLAGTAKAATTVKPPQHVKMVLPPVGDFPDAECNEESFNDIYVDRYGILWECICQKMFSELDCAWYEVPTAYSLRVRAKIKARYHVVPRGVLIRL